MKMKWTSILSGTALLLVIFVKAQNIENKEVLKPFIDKLNENKVTQILFLGDSHIQADWITSFLRNKFRE